MKAPPIDIEAPIIPKQSLGGFKLRTHIEELEDIIFGLGVWKEGSCKLMPPFEARYTFGKGEVEIAVDVRNGKIFRISAHTGYKGKLFNQIGIGMPVREVFELEPKLYYDEPEEMILHHDILGISLDIFDIDPPPALVPNMNIDAISVYDVEAIPY
jgi:hypothetical protein